MTGCLPPNLTAFQVVQTLVAPLQVTPVAAWFWVARRFSAAIETQP